MDTTDHLPADHRKRSNFVRRLVERVKEHDLSPNVISPAIPRTIVQFWDNHASLPEDVQECIDSWSVLRDQAFTILLFDDTAARRFILERLGVRHEHAYVKCYHPAMRSDYFRLCFVYSEGGCYVDRGTIAAVATRSLVLGEYPVCRRGCMLGYRCPIVAPHRFAGYRGFTFAVDFCPLSNPISRSGTGQRHHRQIQKAYANRLQVCPS
jgi:hypothetical protein